MFLGLVEFVLLCVSLLPTRALAVITLAAAVYCAILLHRSYTLSLVAADGALGVRGGAIGGVSVGSRVGCVLMPFRGCYRRCALARSV